MTGIGTLQIVLYLFVLLLLVKPLGWYMARVYEGKPCGLDRIISPLERFTYRVCGITPEQEMSWKSYLAAMLLFNLLGIVFIYAILRLQHILPFNPQGFPAITPDLSFNVATSFTTNTNWQAYTGESTLSYSTQMLALTVQNFLSAASGIAILVAMIRGIVRHESNTLGNFWVDVVRSIYYILLPLALVFAVVLTSQGVIQNLKPTQTINVVQTTTYDQAVTDVKGKPKFEKKQLTQQFIPMGPVASQVAIEVLGTNGGGFFGANTAHPFENPNALTNLLEMLALLLIPAALCYTYGAMVGDTRQGWAILIAMLFVFVPLVFAATAAEQCCNPQLVELGINHAAVPDLSSGGNMEGKETRFGITNSSLWTVAATASGNGSTNAALDSFTPIGGMIPLWLIDLGEVIFGGVGSGLSGMLIYVILTVFVAGLMVGRTPEYLGKKIQPYEMKMASFAVLVMPAVVLILTAVSVVTKAGIDAIGNHGAHGFTEILYAFSSMTNNNGSAFGGLSANTPYYNLWGGIAMLVGRYWLAIPTLAIAGSLARKKAIPCSSGTLPTHTLLFIILLVCVVMVVGALTYFPALALGPLVEQLMLWAHYVS
jgi:K+-transporting ATPase ATPase A chain